MGLAERFKDKLENKDIFQKGNIEETLELSTEQKKNMIEKYFEKRIQSEMYSSISYSNSDKKEFVENILTLSNYR